MRPLLFVHNHVPADRIAQYALLVEAEDVEFALHGGRLHHALPGEPRPPLPHRHVHQRDIYRLAAGGDYRGVVASTNGRLAPFAAYAGARRAKVPFVLWATLWSLPSTVAGRLGAPLVHRLYRDADAVVTYGEHVSEHVRAHGAQAPIAAPQASDAAFWGAAVADPRREAPFQALWIGRTEPGKGSEVALEAWERAALPDAVLQVVGALEPPRAVPGVRFTGRLEPREVRRLYAGSDVLLVTSVPTRTFHEPWALVVNEAMHAGTPVVATDAVGAVAGGLLAARPQRPRAARRRRRRAQRRATPRARRSVPARAACVTAARDDVGLQTPATWAQAMSHAFALVGISRVGASS